MHGEPECFHVPLNLAPSFARTEAPLFGTLPYVSLHLAIDLYPFSYPLVNWQT